MCLYSDLQEEDKPWKNRCFCGGKVRPSGLQIGQIFLR